MGDTKQRRLFRRGHLIEEEALSRVARIIGDSSSAALALRELQSRIAAGQQVECRMCGEWFVIGPKELANAHHP